MPHGVQASPLKYGEVSGIMGRSLVKYKFALDTVGTPPKWINMEIRWPGEMSPFSVSLNFVGDQRFQKWNLLQMKKDVRFDVEI